MSISMRAGGPSPAPTPRTARSIGSPSLRRRSRSFASSSRRTISLSPTRSRSPTATCSSDTVSPCLIGPRRPRPRSRGRSESISVVTICAEPRLRGWRGPALCEIISPGSSTTSKVVPAPHGSTIATVTIARSESRSRHGREHWKRFLRASPERVRQCYRFRDANCHYIGAGLGCCTLFKRVRTLIRLCGRLRASRTLSNPPREVCQAIGAHMPLSPSKPRRERWLSDTLSPGAPYCTQKRKLRSLSPPPSHCLVKETHPLLVLLPEAFGLRMPARGATVIPPTHGLLNATLPRCDGRPHEHHHESIQLILNSRSRRVTDLPVPNRAIGEHRQAQLSSGRRHFRQNAVRIGLLVLADLGRGGRPSGKALDERDFNRFAADDDLRGHVARIGLLHGPDAAARDRPYEMRAGFRSDRPALRLTGTQQSVHHNQRPAGCSLRHFDSKNVLGRLCSWEALLEATSRLTHQWMQKRTLSDLYWRQFTSLLKQGLPSGTETLSLRPFNHPGDNLVLSVARRKRRAGHGLANLQPCPESARRSRNVVTAAHFRQSNVGQSEFRGETLDRPRPHLLVQFVS